jgi:Zn-dependent oligopeptidase
VPPQELFRMFRGRDPDVKFMLENRGLIWVVSKTSDLS